MIEWMMKGLGYQDITSLMFFVSISVGLSIYLFEDSLKKALFKFLSLFMPILSQVHNLINQEKKNDDIKNPNKPYPLITPSHEEISLHLNENNGNSCEKRTPEPRGIFTCIFKNMHDTDNKHPPSKLGGIAGKGMNETTPPCDSSPQQAGGYSRWNFYKDECKPQENNPSHPWRYHNNIIHQFNAITKSKDGSKKNSQLKNGVAVHVKRIINRLDTKCKQYHH